MNVTNNTEFVIQITPPGVITFTVNAVNILGNGRESSVTSELAWMFQVMSKNFIISNVYMYLAESFFITWHITKPLVLHCVLIGYALFSYFLGETPMANVCLMWPWSIELDACQRLNLSWIFIVEYSVDNEHTFQQKLGLN